MKKVKFIPIYEKLQSEPETKTIAQIKSGGREFINMLHQRVLADYLYNELKGFNLPELSAIATCEHYTSIINLLKRHEWDMQFDNDYKLYCQKLQKLYKKKLSGKVISYAEYRKTNPIDKSIKHAIYKHRAEYAAKMTKIIIQELS